MIGNTAAWTEYKLYCGRYLVTNDGRAAKLSPTNSAVFADGTTVDETKGHVMWIGPRLYYRVQTDSVSGVPILWLSMLPIVTEAFCCTGFQSSCRSPQIFTGATTYTITKLRLNIGISILG